MFAQNSTLVKQVASAKATTVPQYTKNQESEGIEYYIPTSVVINVKIWQYTLYSVVIESDINPH